jgi:hypothetical protein
MLRTLSSARLVAVLAVLLPLRCALAAPEKATPKLMLWLRADDLKNLQDGDRLDRWPDAAGRYDAVAKDASRPFYRAKGAAGWPAVAFDPNLAANPKVVRRLTLPLAGEWPGGTILMVGTKANHLVWLGTTPGGHGDLRLLGSVQWCNTPNSPALGLALPDKPGLQIVGLTAGLADDGLRLSVYADGQQMGSFNGKSGVYGLIWKDASLGGYLDWVGFDGEICELLVYQGELSDRDRQAAERYLGRKYKLKVAQPEGENLPNPPGWPLPPVPKVVKPPLPPVTTQPVTTGLRYWFKADDLKLDSGRLVDHWPAAVGGTALTSSGDARPTFVAEGLNGRPALRFDGDKQANPPVRQKLNATLPDGQYKESTVILVGQGLTTGGSFGSDFGRPSEVRLIGNLQHCGSALGASAPLLGLLSRGQLFTLVTRFDKQGGRMLCYANGQLQTDRAAAPKDVQHPYVEFNNLQIGEYFDPMRGTIAEILIYDKALSDAERRQTERYLTQKYSLLSPTPEQAVLARTPWSLAFPHLSATQSWAANSFSGKPHWVQTGIFDCCILPDGAIVACSVWDEAHKEIGFYKDGQALGGFGGGCAALGTDGRFLYVGVSGMGKAQSGVKRMALKPGDPLAIKDEPPLPLIQVPADQWSRLFLREAPWPGKKPGEPIWFTTAKAWDEVVSIVPVGTELWVTVGGLKDIQVLNRDQGTVQRTIPCIAPPRKLAVAKDGMVWAEVGTQVIQLTAEGQPTGKRIEGLKPGGLAVDAAGHVLVGDVGVRQQVVTFDVTGPQPKEIAALGERGGVYAGPRPGTIASSRLMNPIDVEIDPVGNLVVLNAGCLIRGYTPAGKHLWDLQATSFCMAPDFDPASDGQDMYSGMHHFAACPGQPAGRDWVWRGTTLDPFRFDEKLVGTANQDNLCQRINGRLYRVVVADDIKIAEQEPGSEIFVPRAIYCQDERTHFWRPAEAPKKGRYLWSDRNGDGKVQPEEISVPAPNDHNPTQSFSIWMDDRGDLWEPMGRWGMRHIPAKMTADGRPTWSLADEIKVPRPSDFLDVERSIYYPATDTMYLAGMTWDHPGGKDWGFGHCGRLTVRYADWSKPTRKIVSRMTYPEGVDTIRSLTIVPQLDRLFVGEMGSATIFAFDTKTGKLLGILEPDVRLFGPAMAWFDQSGAIRATARQNGEILITAEEGLCGKFLVYRLPPGP